MCEKGNSAGEVATPTLDRIKDVSEQSQAIGDFLEWLTGEGGYVIGAYRYHINVPGETDEECWGLGNCPYADHEKHQPSINIYPRHYTFQSLLYRFFDIDPVAEERERRAIIEEIRRAQAA